MYNIYKYFNNITELIRKDAACFELFPKKEQGEVILKKDIDFLFHRQYCNLVQFC